eukprot:2268332-Lingulodinium_polyedra.AAC.1
MRERWRAGACNVCHGRETQTNLQHTLQIKPMNDCAHHARGRNNRACVSSTMFRNDAMLLSLGSDCAILVANGTVP